MGHNGSLICRIQSNYVFLHYVILHKTHSQWDALCLGIMTNRYIGDTSYTWHLNV